MRKIRLTKHWEITLGWRAHYYFCVGNTSHYEEDKCPAKYASGYTQRRFFFAIPFFSIGYLGPLVRGDLGDTRKPVIAFWVTFTKWDLLKIWIDIKTVFIRLSRREKHHDKNGHIQ